MDWSDALVHEALEDHNIQRPTSFCSTEVGIY